MTGRVPTSAATPDRRPTTAGPAPSLDELADQLAGVERALERLEDGTYWVDELTGEPIPDECSSPIRLTRRRPASRRPAG